MKYFILAILTAINVFAFSLTINTGSRSGSEYYIIHLEDDKNMTCNKKLTKDNQNFYICHVDGLLDPKVSNQNLPFMNLSFEKQKNGYDVIIEPKISSEILNLNRSLYENYDSKVQNIPESKHFTIVLDKTIGQVPKEINDGINFPIYYPNMLLPTVGALDLNKAPITYEESGDIGLYLGIKKSYEDGAYNETLRDSRKAISMHPNSIFASEFWLYALRSLDKISKRSDDYRAAEKYANEIITDAKLWMKSFASDRNYPEVLYLVMNAYLTQEMQSDANYALDILMTEHPDSAWTKMAILTYADKLLVKGKIDDALNLYEDILYSSKDIAIVSRAAIRLAGASITQQKFNEANAYIQKVITANKEYLLEDIADSMEIANAFRDKNMPQTAAQIYKIIFENSKRGDNYYEVSLRNLALALSKTDEKKAAYEYLVKYQKEFNTSEYMSQISAGVDRLFFDINQTAPNLHEHYANLISKYTGLDIGKKAMLQDIKLYYDEKKYPKVLSYKEQILDLNSSEASQILRDSALILANSANQNGDCKLSVRLVKEYDLKEDIKDKFKLYGCYMRTAQYEDALNLALPHIKDDDLHDRVEWLARVSRTLFELGRYEDCIRACDEALSIASTIKYSDPTEAIFYRFYSFIKLNKFEDAISSINALESLRGTDIRLVEIYDIAAKYASLKGFDSAALNYAKKAVDMQEKLKITTFSPEIDFIYIGALMKISRQNEALNVAKSLLEIRLNPEQRQRALYQVGEIYINQNDFTSAKPYVSECVSSNFSSPWKELCKEQNKLIN